MATQDPYGSGIVCPFRRDGKGDFANNSGLVVLKSDVAELLGIIGPSASEPGELPWDTERGARLIVLKHRGIHKEMTRATAEQMAAGTIRRYEPRVQVGPTVVRGEGATLTIAVRYTPLGFQKRDVQEVEIRPVT